VRDLCLYVICVSLLLLLKTIDWYAMHVYIQCTNMFVLININIVYTNVCFSAVRICVWCVCMCGGTEKRSQKSVIHEEIECGGDYVG